MWGFLLGSLAGVLIRVNGPKVRHGIAVLIVKSEKCIGDIASGAQATATRLSEDWEDIKAEAAAGTGSGK
jgi:hypothetical protein